MAIQWEGFLSAGIRADSNKGNDEGDFWPAGIRGSQIGPGKPDSDI